MVITLIIVNVYHIYIYIGHYWALFGLNGLRRVLRLPLVRSFDTQQLLHTDAFTHQSFYTQTRWHTDAFTHSSFCTQKLLHTDAFTHRGFPGLGPKSSPPAEWRIFGVFLHTDVFTHRSFYTQKLFHTEAFPASVLKTKALPKQSDGFLVSFFHAKAFTHRSFYT